MKQLLTVLKFEFLNIVKGKVFIGLTIAMVLIMGAVLFSPRVLNLFNNSEEKGGEVTSESSESKDVLGLIGNIQGNKEEVAKFIEKEMPGYKIELSTATEEEINKKIENGDYEGVISVESPEKYKYITNSVSMYDSMPTLINTTMSKLYKIEEMKKQGISINDANNIINKDINVEVVELGKSQGQTFLYTYIVIFILYMATIIYGQQIATSVASEKTSRAMEILITSAKPKNLIFGKVIGSGLAGLTQIVIIIGSGAIFYNMNKDVWGGNEIIKYIFDIPTNVIIYSAIFFLLGYFIYAFIFGALGSLASRTEDINTSTMPITVIFIVGFFIVITAMNTGSLNSTVMVIASYIPFTSPMAMFARISMSDVAFIEILISIIILIASSVGIGYLSAAIYKKGVLLYGKTIKITEIRKLKKM